MSLVTAKLSEPKNLYAILERMIAQKGMGVKAGVPENATNEEGEHIATYAAYNEFGTSRVPARSFMRTTYEKQSKIWILVLIAALKRSRYADFHTALEETGKTMAEDIKQTIESNVPPELSKRYDEWKAKKHPINAGKTLVRTGAMRNSIIHVVTQR